MVSVPAITEQVQQYQDIVALHHFYVYEDFVHIVNRRLLGVCLNFKIVTRSCTRIVNVCDERFLIRSLHSLYSIRCV